jgi:hypothetical protein
MSRSYPFTKLSRLPRLLNHTQIRAQIPDAAGENPSQADARSGENQAMELADNEANGRILALPVALEGMAVREGFEPSDRECVPSAEGLYLCTAILYGHYAFSDHVRL